MRRLLIPTALAAALALVPVAASAHNPDPSPPGHQGGCEDFGHVNLVWAQNAAEVAAALESALGIDLPADVDTLGGIVSWFARHKDSPPDGGPGVGDVVETFDHAACGPD